jgi:anthranilate phosphoribosyltransferase
VDEWVIHPAEHGLASDDLPGLAGGDPAENARLIERLLRGEGAAAVRCTVLLNAAAALYVSGRGWTFSEATQRAAESLDGGAAGKVLERLRRAAPLPSP